jgi:glyoxylase-like metal-dependent hydrolase (beta-lactamase superfamily II)
MKVTKAAEHLYRLSYIGFVNCYLVQEDDGFTLVDAAVKGQGPAILRAARDLGIPVRRIALTHAHIDHVGAVDELHQALPEAQIAISARDARFLTGDMSLDPGEPATKLRGGFPRVAAVPGVLLHEGDHVGSLEVIASPGHTPGHVAFLDTRDGALIAGDAFQTKGGVAVSGTIVPLFPLPALATWSKPLALASARALLARQPSVLTVGHGPALRDPQAAMQRAIDTLGRSLARQKAA